MESSLSFCSSTAQARRFHTPSVSQLRQTCRQQGAIRRNRVRQNVVAGVLEPGAKVLVVGATGGVGQLVTAKLLERGFQVRAVCRNPEKAAQSFGAKSDALEVLYADCRDPSTLLKIAEGVDAVCCATGTTAFPSARWKDGNGPESTDWTAVKNLIQACPKDLKRFVFTTSAGVERSDKMPFNILNLFGVLKYKRQSEKLLEESGLPYTIIRPSRLTDGPYTSYDLNTLLKATSGARQNVFVSGKDDQLGECSRIACAEAMVQALQLATTENKVFALASVEGDGPAQDAAKWERLFEAAS